MSRKVQMIGNTYGRLEVIEEAGTVGKQLTFLCKCSCGNTKVVKGNSLRTGNTKSCGCLQKETFSATITKHSKRYSPEYNIYYNMVARCYNRDNSHYKNYGGRGITMCDTWRDSFEAFYKDMGERPKGMTIDRIDNDKGYSPDNCRWASTIEQGRNKSTNFNITYKGVTRCMAEWSQHLGINHGTLRNRILRNNWSVEKAFTTPVRKMVTARQSPATAR